MLEELSVQNYALVDRLTVRFSDGMNVLSGETGAGKSLVLDALDVLLGRRVGQEVVRTGAEGAVIEALIVADGGGPAAGLMEAAGIEGPTVTLRREVERSGRGGASVNGRTVQVRTLREVSGRLFDIHGPNQQFSLLFSFELLTIQSPTTASPFHHDRFHTLSHRHGLPRLSPGQTLWSVGSPSRGRGFAHCQEAPRQAWPNRVHCCYGLLFRLWLLSTLSVENAVTIGYGAVTDSPIGTYTQ